MRYLLVHRYILWHRIFHKIWFWFKRWHHKVWRILKWKRMKVRERVVWNRFGYERVLEIIILLKLICFIGLLLHFKNFISLVTCRFFELGSFNLPVVHETLRMFIFEMKIKSGITEIDFFTVTLITCCLFIMLRITTLSLFYLLSGILMILLLTTHFDDFYCCYNLIIRFYKIFIINYNNDLK